MTITFMHSDPEGPPAVTRKLRWKSPYFRTAHFEFDSVQGANKVTTINTYDHNNHPQAPSLVREQLTIDKVYDRAGVEVMQSLARNVVPLTSAGADELWTDQELHDAMKVYWSRYVPRSQWALWMLFAAGRHLNTKVGTTTARGIMFDYSDNYQRQGAAVFNNVWESVVPQDYPQRPEHIARMRFFAAVHEIGHCFNLAHSFEKGMSDEKSFMNYPEGDPAYPAVPGAVEAFFGEFEYGFSDTELRHIRHSRDRFVEMAGSQYGGEGHGYDPEPIQAESAFTLEVTVARPRAVFEFLEPVIISVALTNVSTTSQIVDAEILNDPDSLALVISQRNKRPRLWRPYARVCALPSARELQPGESMRASFFVGAGLNGWEVAEPGAYTIHVGARVSHADVVAKPVRLRVASPQSWDEELVSQNFLTDEVARALAFGGTYTMTSAIEALQEAADRLKDRAVAHHALLALALPRMRNSKVLRLPEGRSSMSSVAADGGRIDVVSAKPDEARRMFDAALLDNSTVSAETFGHHAYTCHVEMYADWLEQSGDAGAAEKARRFVSLGANTAGA